MIISAATILDLSNIVVFLLFKDKPLPEEYGRIVMGSLVPLILRIESLIDIINPLPPRSRGQFLIPAGVVDPLDFLLRVPALIYSKLDASMEHERLLIG